jgi:branched-chain amino acid transport system ATP-binding protein
MSENYLEVRDLHVHYGNIHALHGVNLNVNKGEIVSVVGANGAGKSTLMWSITGALPVTRGVTSLNGSALPRRPHEIVSLGISLVPERRRLFTSLSVRENLIMGSIKRKDRNAVNSDIERCFSLYPVLKERLSQRSGTLSGGEQQMLAIARALMSRPSVLLLDEPSLGLAPLIVTGLFETITKIRSEGVTVLMVEQNAYKALEISDRGYVMQAGRIIKTGTGAELLEDPAVKAAYLGG